MFNWFRRKRRETATEEKPSEAARKEEPRVTKVLVLYYSSYGHVERLAQAVAEGAGSVAGAQVAVKRVRELVPEDVARQSGMKLDQSAPIAEPGELAQYDAIIVGTPTRFGNMAAQMRNFWDQTGPLWFGMPTLMKSRSRSLPISPKTWESSMGMMGSAPRGQSSPAWASSQELNVRLAPDWSVRNDATG